VALLSRPRGQKSIYFGGIKEKTIKEDKTIGKEEKRTEE
jgi:hypothetical protein